MLLVVGNPFWLEVRLTVGCITRISHTQEQRQILVKHPSKGLGSTKFWSCAHLRALLCIMTVSTPTDHTKKNQQALTKMLEPAQNHKMISIARNSKYQLNMSTNLLEVITIGGGRLGFILLVHFVFCWACGGRDYHIGSNFWKFYLIRTSFTWSELVSLVKVFRRSR